MKDSPRKVTGPSATTAGTGQARLLAAGSLLQQAAQASGLVVLLVIVTVLARRLSLSELGAYGLVAGLSGSLLVLRNSVASSAVRSMASAPDDSERAGAFSTAAALYAAAGLGTGAIIALAGSAIAAVVLSGDLEHQARLGALLLGGITAVGLTVSVYLDALRGSLLFTRAAATELVALAIHLGVMLALILSGASLWVLIGVSGELPLLSGLLSTAVVRLRRLPYRFRAGAVTRERAAAILPTAGYLFVVELSNLVIYALDRVILGAYRDAATVGLYEGPLRVHNLFWALNGALAVTTLPAASRYTADADEHRRRELVVRGSRYTLALFVPLAVTVMALAAPILDVWLGERFREGATALTILVSYWLLYGALAVTPGLLVGAGRAREVAIYLSRVAAANLALSLILTPLVGLEGPALGTAIPFFVAFPFFLRLSRSAIPVALERMAREAWLPAYSLGLALGAGLVLLRLLVPLDSLPAVVGAGAGGLALYWAAFYLAWLAPGERALVRSLVKR